MGWGKGLMKIFLFSLLSFLISQPIFSYELLLHWDCLYLSSLWKYIEYILFVVHFTVDSNRLKYLIIDGVLDCSFPPIWCRIIYPSLHRIIFYSLNWFFSSLENYRLFYFVTMCLVLLVQIRRYYYIKTLEYWWLRRKIHFII